MEQAPYVWDPVLAPRPPQQLSWSWQATGASDAGRWSVHPLGPPFLATWQLEVALWSSSGQWDVSRGQAAGWHFWGSFCLTAEKGHSQLTDPSIHHSYSCGHQDHSWYMEAQLPPWDNKVLSMRMTTCEGRWHRENRKCLGPGNICEQLHQSALDHLPLDMSKEPHKSVTIQVTRVGILLQSVRCTPNWGCLVTLRFLLSEKKLFLLEEIGFSPIRLVTAPNTHPELPHSKKVTATHLNVWSQSILKNCTKNYMCLKE